MPNTKKSKVITDADGRDVSGRDWLYSPIVKDHFFNPRNLMKAGEEESFQADGVGYVGSPACGDAMKVWIEVKQDRIIACKWRTFGCGSAIASTSMMSVMVTENGGMELERALKIKPRDIMERLGGLPTRKVHCSVLGDKALRQAVNDYFRRSGQIDRIKIEDVRVLDKKLKITGRDIEEAVLEGADTLEKVQAKTKVGTGDPSCLPEVEKLIKFYVKKYYG